MKEHLLAGILAASLSTVHPTIVDIYSQETHSYPDITSSSQLYRVEKPYGEGTISSVLYDTDASGGPSTSDTLVVVVRDHDRRIKEFYRDVKCDGIPEEAYVASQGKMEDIGKHDLFSESYLKALQALRQ